MCYIKTDQNESHPRLPLQQYTLHAFRPLLLPAMSNVSRYEPVLITVGSGDGSDVKAALLYEGFFDRSLQMPRSTYSSIPPETRHKYTKSPPPSSTRPNDTKDSKHASGSFELPINSQVTDWFNEHLPVSGERHKDRYTYSEPPSRPQVGLDDAPEFLGNVLHLLNNTVKTKILKKTSVGKSRTRDEVIGKTLRHFARHLNEGG